MTVKVFNYNPVSEMTDSEILDYLEDCYKDSYRDNDHLRSELAICVRNKGA